MKNTEKKEYSHENSLLELTDKTVPMLEQLTAGMPGGFFIYHADGEQEIIFANNALIKLYGCRDLVDFKNYTGYTFKGMIHPDDREKVTASIAEQINDNGSEFDYVEYRMIRKDGQMRWMCDYGHFLKSDFYGDIFYVFIEDITVEHYQHIDDERARVLLDQRLSVLEKLEHETTSLKIVHEILGSGMWTAEFDSEGNMESITWSDAFRKMLGFKGESDFPNIMESWTELIHPMDKEHVLCEFYSTIYDYSGKKIFDCEYRMRTNDRGVRWFRSAGKLSRREDGTPITYVGMFVDVTQQKETDMALSEQRKLLEDALKQAEKSSRSKTIFLNNMSHDIRTPMNAIIGFTSLAASKIDNKELVKDYLDKIMASSNHLLSIINDVLDMSRIESGKTKIAYGRQNIVDIIQDLKTVLQADICTKNMKFYIDLSSIVHQNVICDKLRLNQVLMNILSNAVKFTPSGGTISLTITEDTADAESSRYIFELEDNGIGMNEEFVKHIFEPFERERTSTISGIQGTGLGMAITKNIVDLMNGDIEVESVQGKGTKFTVSFVFPLWEDSDREKKDSVLKGLKVLIVSGDERVCRNAEILLEKVGGSGKSALSGENAVEMAKKENYDLFLIDRSTRDICGRDTAAKLKQNHVDESKIIMMSYDWADLEENIHKNRNFCSKPLFLSDLEEIVSKSPAPKKKSNIASFRGKHVLLVEDNELNQEIAMAILEETGLSVDLAVNGKEAVEKVKADKKHKYSLVLMDIQMPVMDGIEASRRIRESEDKALADIPILAMTANAFEEDKQSAFEAGMNGHIDKPIDIEKLMETLKEYLK